MAKPKEVGGAQVGQAARGAYNQVNNRGTVKQTPVSNASFLSRFTQRAKNTITGVQQAWFGPLDPLVPMATPDPIGRAFDYQVGYNLQVQPRPYEPGMFSDLRNLSDNCDVLRLVIEKRKDQLEALPWTIKPKVDEGTSGPDYSGKIKEIMDFLTYPDHEHDWSQWLRIIMEDVFVLDASAIYRRPFKAGKLYSLDIIDGSTIARKIDATGRMPMGDQPAYQQVLKGIPAVDYTSAELLYLQRNPRSHTPYGLSPVEQIIITTNTQIRRMIEQLTYFTDGNIPLGFGTLPKEYTPAQIIDFGQAFNAMRTGNQAERSQMVFMPGDFKYTPAKEAPLKNDLDEWLARKICFAFSVSADPFVTKVNRATAETSKDQATEEGIVPTQKWLKRVMDRIIREDFQAPYLEFTWQNDKEQDEEVESNINVNYVKSGIKSIDEVRTGLGLDAQGGPYAVPSLATATGYVPVGESSTPPPAENPDGDPHGNNSNPSAPPAKKKPAGADSAAAGKKAKKHDYGDLYKRGQRTPVPFIAPQPKRDVRH